MNLKKIVIIVYFIGLKIWNDFFFLISYDDQSQSMEPGYPQSIASFFPGIESRVDAVFQENCK